MIPLNSSLVSSRQRSRAAFTLVELLSVIAIIGVLAAIIIPTVGSIRTSARWAQGSANIRQSTMAMIVMANEDRGRLRYWNERNSKNETLIWANVLTQYVAGQNIDISPSRTNPMLLDPLVEGAPDSSGVFHYASADLQAPDFSRKGQFTPGAAPLGTFAAWAQYLNIKAYPNPAAQVLLVDAAIDPSTNKTWGNLPQGPLSIWTIVAQVRSTANDPIDPGTGEPGNIRWTDGKAKFGFMDGHVAILKPSEVKKKNFNPALQ